MTQPPTGPAEPYGGEPQQGQQPGYPPPGQPYPPPQPGQQPGYGPPGYGQSGYGQPPPGYPPSGGHFQGPPPRGYASQDDKTWALITHFGAAGGVFISGGVLGFVAPLIALLGRGNQSPTVKEHAKSALNFFIPLAAVAFLLILLRSCGSLHIGLLGTLFSALLGLVIGVLWIVGIVFGVVGGIRANDGQVYRYPLNLSLIK